jgi:hypothetical protein
MVMGTLAAKTAEGPLLKHLWRSWGKQPFFWQPLKSAMAAFEGRHVK